MKQDWNQVSLKRLTLVNLFSQQLKSKKSQKYFFSKEQRIKGAVDCLDKMVDWLEVFPVLNALVSKFFSRDYSKSYMKKLRQSVLKRVCDDNKAVVIQSVLVRRAEEEKRERKKSWFSFVVSKSLILEWWKLENDRAKNKRLPKTKTGQIIQERADMLRFDQIVTMFRNKFFVFFDNGKRDGLKQENKFMRMFFKKRSMMYGYMVNLQKQSNMKQAEDIQRYIVEPKVDTERFRALLEEEDITFETFVDRVYEFLSAKHEESGNEGMPNLPNYLEIRDIYNNKDAILSIEKESGQEFFTPFLQKKQTPKNYHEFVGKVYETIAKEHEESGNEGMPIFPSGQVLEGLFYGKQTRPENTMGNNCVSIKDIIKQNFPSDDKMSTLNLKETDINIKKINGGLTDRILKCNAIQKIRFRGFFSREYSLFPSTKSKNIKKFRFHTFKMNNNVRSLSKLTAFMNDNGFKQLERFIKFKKIDKNGNVIPIWNTRRYMGNDLTTPCMVKKKIFSWLKLIFRKNRGIYFELLESLGITKIKKYKQIKGYFSKKEWYNVIMLGYKSLLYAKDF